MIEILIGHMIGDFLLQSKRIAIAKGGNLFECTKHVMLYSVVVCACMGRFDILSFIALPHFVIDYYSLGGRLPWGRRFDNMEGEFDKIFTCIVYVINDQILHFLCLYGVWKWL